jgi:hypothetical protein
MIKFLYELFFNTSYIKNRLTENITISPTNLIISGLLIDKKLMFMFTN